MSSVYTSPKPSALPADYEEFFKSLTAKEQLLLEIAREKLGSSFFVQWCRLYLDWKAKQKP
jgi:hypothetical protein